MADEVKQRNMTSLYLHNNGKYLLLKRQGSRVVNSVWIGSAGGHIENDELNDARACVLRELKEELGLEAEHISNLKLRYITLRHTQNEIRVNYYFFADLLNGNVELCSNEGELKWVSEEQLKELPMPFTAEKVMGHYLSTGRYSDEIYGGIVGNREVSFVSMPVF